MERDPLTGRLFRGDPTGRSDKGRAGRASRRAPVVAAAAMVVLAAIVGTIWLLGAGVGGEPAPAALGTAVPTTTGHSPTATRTTAGTTNPSTSTSSPPTETTTETTSTGTTAPPVVVPDPPSGLTAVAVDPTSIQLAWTDQSTNETAFEVDDGQTTRTAAADAQTLLWDGLAPGQQACFRVRSVGDAGASAWEPVTDPGVCAQTPQSPQQAAQPDLVAQPIELLSGATVCSGDSPVFQASVVNGGSAPSEDFLVRWVADGGQPSDEVRGGLPPQGADKYQFTWSAVPAGPHSLTFLADGDGRIGEADETNNGSGLTFTAVDCPG